MAEKIKITGTASAKEYSDLDYRVELMPTRVFAEEAYHCADSMLAQREEQPQ